MNKKKLIRNVSLVALSAVMMCGTAVAFAGCGADTTYTLRVNIFCNDSDAATNENICKNWAKKYTEEHRSELGFPEGQDVEIIFQYNSDTTVYFDSLKRDYSGGTAADIIYLSPKYVRAWAEMGRVMDISSFVDAQGVEDLEGIWPDSLGFYSYAMEETRPAGKTYSSGERVHYDAQGAQGAGFYTASGVKVGIYGLPKDYSNFAMAFNGKFFSTNMRYAMTHTKATQTRNVKGAAEKNTSKLTFQGGANEAGVITYAVSGEYDIAPENMISGKSDNKLQATAGQDANIINPGVPTRYKPYNFYRFASYKDAIAGGDLIATAVEQWSPDINGDKKGDGFVVTIPGFPGDTWTIDDSWRSAEAHTTVDKNANYDTSIEHCVYTYQEFGALTWAVTYFCNTFNWNCKNTSNDGAETKNNSSAWTIEGITSGTGGVKNDVGTMNNIYGNDQYEGAPGPTLYLLPWLFGNDADFINLNADKAVADGAKYTLADATAANTVDKMKEMIAGAQPEKQSRLHLDGTSEMTDIHYGANTEEFIETFGAFLEYGSTWNGNCGNVGDDDASKSDNGWAYFRGGAELFYGSGTWDSSTRNESDLDDYCEFHNMPSPISEDFALYSQVKDGFGDQVEYSTGENGTRGTKTLLKQIDKAKAADPKLPSGPFTLEQVKKNQLTRQDQWGARMDSVGFAANAALEGKAGTGEEWKIKAAASLIMELCVNEDAQRTLTYAGAQIPNFMEQCEDFLNYNNEEYNTNLGRDNVFKDMVTPDDEKWDTYYEVVWMMNQATYGEGDYAAFEGKTVKEFMDEIHKDPKYADVTYDEQYAATPLADASLPKGNSHRNVAMKILRMVTFNKADRDLNLRMMYGINSARDSAMYTYNTEWIEKIYMRDGRAMAYNLSKPLTAGQTITNMLSYLSSESITIGSKYQTAAAFVLRTCEEIKTKLDEAKAKEQKDIDEYRENRDLGLI